MLETAREYAVECLTASGDEQVLRRTHAACFLSLAELVEPELTGPTQIAWMDRLEAEHQNPGAAQSWMKKHGEIESGLRLATVLERFGDHRGHDALGRRWLDGFLTSSETIRPAIPGKALRSAGVLAIERGDYPRAEESLREALRIAKEFGRPGAKRLPRWQSQAEQEPQRSACGPAPVRAGRSLRPPVGGSKRRQIRRRLNRLFPVRGLEFAWDALVNGACTTAVLPPGLACIRSGAFLVWHGGTRFAGYVFVNVPGAIVRSLAGRIDRWCVTRELVATWTQRH